MVSEKEWRTIQNIVRVHGLCHIRTPLWKLPLHFCTWKLWFIFTVDDENCHSLLVLVLVWHLLPLGVIYPIKERKCKHPAIYIRKTWNSGVNMNKSYEATRNQKLFDCISPRKMKKDSILKSTLKNSYLAFLSRNSFREYVNPVWNS